MLTIPGVLKADAIIVHDKMSTSPLIILPVISFDFFGLQPLKKKILKNYSTITRSTEV